MSTASPLPRLIDIGVNLSDPSYNGIYRDRKVHDSDLDQVMRRAQAAGVINQVVTVGQMEEFDDALSYTKKYQGLYCTIGVHPTRTSQSSEDYIEQMRASLDRHALSDKNKEGKIVAIGELGLDYDRFFFSSKESQIDGLERQLNLALEFDLPLFLHCRGAHEDLMSILKGYVEKKGHEDILTALKGYVSGESKRTRLGVVHCFTGSVEEMKEIVKMGFFVGLTGCSFKSEELLQMVKEVPLDRLLLETDAPWCEMRATHASASILKDFHSKKPELAKLYQPGAVNKNKHTLEKTVSSRSEPCAVGAVAAVVANLKGVDIHVVAKATRENAQYLLGI